jgi:hypothetical protein
MTMAKIPEPRQRLIDFYLEDATDRLLFQQEFSVAGFKTLMLINGGAVIALLTYAGNANHRTAAANLQWAFGGYIAGLVAGVLAYLTAYAGQALIMRFSAAAALAELRIKDLDQEIQDRRERRANLCISFGVGLCVLSLLSFVAASIAAMRGLT